MRSISFWRCIRGHWTNKCDEWVTANEDEPAYRVMQRLRVARLGLAGVLDRHRNLSGVVMIEDLIRRLVQSS